MKKIVLPSVMASLFSGTAMAASVSSGNWFGDNTLAVNTETTNGTSQTILGDDGRLTLKHIANNTVVRTKSVNLVTEAELDSIEQEVDDNRTNINQNKVDIAGVTATANQNKTAIADVTTIANQNKTAIADVTTIANQNKTAIADVTTTANQNKTAIADITTTANQNKTAIADVTTTANQNKTAIADVTTTANQNKTAIANVTTTTNQNRTDIANNSARITDNTKRISKIEFQVQDLYSEVKRLDGAIAATTAVGSMITPKYQGDTVISVGMGHYNGSSALALGATHNIGEQVALRATVAGSDADNWNNPIMGASVNWAF